VAGTVRKIDSGTVLDRKYRIDDVLGSGGMGCVYRATNVVLKRKVAVKTLISRGSGDDAAIQRFHREAQFAASIGHDNICEVIDFGTARVPGIDVDIYYLVMPLLEGRPLSAWLSDWVRPGPAVLVDVMAQTLIGLHAAHERKIVHRDLKPDNIFITDVGDRKNFVKILDFGVSKYMESDTAVQLTRTGITMGTPLYMSPEQARGARHVDHAADIYSAGVVLYEAFVGQLPYDGDNFNEVLLRIATEPFAPPRIVNPNVPPAMERVILRAMARNPAERYASARLMREELMKAAEEGCIPHMASFVYNRPRASRPAPNADAATIVGPAVDAAQVEKKLKKMNEVLTRGSTRSRRTVDRASPSRNPSSSGAKKKRAGGNRRTAALVAVIVLVALVIGGIAFLAVRSSRQEYVVPLRASEDAPDVRSLSTHDEPPAVAAPVVQPSIDIPTENVALPVAQPDAMQNRETPPPTSRRRTVRTANPDAGASGGRAVDRNAEDIFSE